MKEQDLFKKAAEVFYGKKKEEKENKSKERSALLNDLGDNLTPAQILYSTNRDLRKIKNKKRSDSLIKIKEKFKNLLEEKLSEREPEPLKGGISYYQQTEDSGQDDENFQAILKNLYNAEGGYSNDKYDRGGKTNFGITQKTYDAYNKKQGLPLKDVKEITKDESDKIYYNEYYKASGADKIKDKDLAYMHFDAAVNHGVGRAKQFREKAGDDFDKYYQARKDFYTSITSKRPEQKRFYNGWINRIDKIKNNREEY